MHLKKVGAVAICMLASWFFFLWFESLLLLLVLSMGIWGSGNGVELGRARSQPERLLVPRMKCLHLYAGCQSSATLAASICWCACKQSRCRMGAGRQEHPPGDRPPTLGPSQALPSLGRPAWDPGLRGIAHPCPASPPSCVGLSREAFNGA